MALVAPAATAVMAATLEGGAREQMAMALVVVLEPMEPVLMEGDCSGAITPRS